MNLGYVIAALGVIGVLAGAVMYGIAWHRTIGLGGVVLGVILLIAGLWFSRQAKPKPVPATTP